MIWTTSAPSIAIVHHVNKKPYRKGLKRVWDAVMCHFRFCCRGKRSFLNGGALHVHVCVYRQEKTSHANPPPAHEPSSFSEGVENDVSGPQKAGALFDCSVNDPSDIQFADCGQPTFRSSSPPSVFSDSVLTHTFTSFALFLSRFLFSGVFSLGRAGLSATEEGPRGAT